MKLRTLAVAAALTVFAAPAFAAGSVSVTLQAPLADAVKVVAGGSVFHCAGATCVSAAASNRAMTAKACKELVKEVGPVSAYGDGRKQLEADDLARCNETAAN